MRCKCCDAMKTRWFGDGYYCSKCYSVIKETIVEDKTVHDLSGTSFGETPLRTKGKEKTDGNT